jgi:hypothetical protein
MLGTIAKVNTTIFGTEEDHVDNANMLASTIGLAEFKDALSRYPALITSFSKPRKFASPWKKFWRHDIDIKAHNSIAKPDSLTLQELDNFRYIDAPSRYSQKAGGKSIELADIKKLVDWKL